MMRYESKKKPGIFLTTDGKVDPKTKTLYVTQDGEKEKMISLATLKRWWKKVEDDTETAEQETPAAPAEADAEGNNEEGAPEAGAPGVEDEGETPAEAPQASADIPEKPSDKTGADRSMKMSETIKTLESIFDNLNALYFEGNLVKPVIIVQSTPRAYGHCSTKKIWKGQAENEAMYEINIGAEFLNRPIENTAATLLHEMVHLFCLENGIADTCQNGRYHNSKFKAEYEARDLAVEYDKANGHAHTSPTEIFTEKLKDSGIDMAFKFARIEPKKKTRTKASRVMYTYTCPGCGQSFKSAAILNLKCGICDMPMERA